MAWIFLLILTIWWFSKSTEKIHLSPKDVVFLPIEEKITEERTLEFQTKFENRLRDVYLPDAISGKEIYIYKNLMNVWYEKLSAEKRYDLSVIQKQRGDWLEYMDALKDKSTYEYLSSESTEKEKAESYRNDCAIASKKVFAIEEAFASAVGDDAVRELARIRALDASVFSKEGELVPEGFEINAEGKIQPKKKKSAGAFFDKLFSRGK